MWDEEDNDYMFEIEGDGNLKYPAVACYANNLVILAETDENTNKDIICYYSSNGAFDLETSFVVNTGDDERFPDIRHVEGNIFVCTFVKEGNLYACTTDNGGASWSSPQQINDNDGSVVEKYRTSDLCEKAVKVMWEDNRGADNDIYMGDIENYPPSISSPNPSNGATEVSVDLSELSVTIEDSDGDTIDWSIEGSDGIGISSGTGEEGGLKTCEISVLNYDTTYTWFVNATDLSGSGENIEEVFTFTTEENEPPKISNPTPEENEENVPTTTPYLRVLISDKNDDFIDWSIEGSDGIGSNSGTGEAGGLKTCEISGLDYGKTYTWMVTAEDPDGSGQTTEKTYSFTTVENNPPDFSIQNPSDGSFDIPLGLSSISVYISDVEGDSFNWSIETRPDIGNSNASEDSDGTKTCDVSGLDYDITYTWFVNATDPEGG